MNGPSAFLDTIVLVYAVTIGDPRESTAQALISAGATVSVQVFNEFVAVSLKRRVPWADILKALRGFRALMPEPKPVTLKTHNRALEISQQRGYHIYDALIIASALESRCTVRYSEDMQGGQTVDGLTICNPFR